VPVSLRLRELREAKDVSQVELARRSGVPQPTISKLEHGELTSISFAQLEALAEALLIRHERKGKRS
jgi:transcriptional regulator with XRE-family HTH domain